MAYGAPDHHIPLEQLVTTLNTKIDLLNTNIETLNTNFSLLCGHTGYEYGIGVDILAGESKTLLQLDANGRITGFYMTMRCDDADGRQNSRFTVVVDGNLKYNDFPRKMFGNPSPGYSVDYGEWGSQNTEAAVYIIHYNVPIQFGMAVILAFKNNSGSNTANIDYVIVYDRYT